jgi:hypothetical protein
MKMREARYAEMEAQAEIDDHANTIIIDTTPEEPRQIAAPQADPNTEEIIEPAATTHKAAAAPAQDTMAGPNF